MNISNIIRWCCSNAVFISSIVLDASRATRKQLFQNTEGKSVPLMKRRLINRFTIIYIISVCPVGSAAASVLFAGRDEHFNTIKSHCAIMRLMQTDRSLLTKLEIHELIRGNWCAVCYQGKRMIGSGRPWKIRNDTSLVVRSMEYFYELLLIVPYSWENGFT